MMEGNAPIAVNTGFTWTSAGVWTTALALMGVIVRQWVPMRKVRIDEFKSVMEAQAAEISRLSERITTLEDNIEGQRERYEAILTFERATHEADLGLQRHATRGTKQILYALLDLIEAAPENAAAHAAKMRARMAELEAIERQESATVRSAKIIASGERKDAA